MATNTTNYSFKKPTVSGDSGVWGGYLNDTIQDLDDLLGGTNSKVITGIDIDSGTIDGATIGGASAGAGSFTTLSASSTFTLGGTAITSTADEINILDGVTSTATELNYVDITTLGTSEASKALTADANGDVTLAEELIAKSYNETYVAPTSSSNATTVDCETGNTFQHTLTENTTFTFSNPPTSGTAFTFTLKIIQDAGASGFTVTWPGAVDWPAATAPTLTATASAVDVFVFYTTDGGTTWLGFTAGQALA
tara:strand:- start:1464 stop:2222 length:759 start_codon:yes stop_codon:yes gene_type:complete